MALPKTDRGNSRFLSKVESLVSFELSTASVPPEEVPINAMEQGVDGRTRAARIKAGAAAGQGRSKTDGIALLVPTDTANTLCSSVSGVRGVPRLLDIYPDRSRPGSPICKA